jgi:hypothetical protein
MKKIISYSLWGNLPLYTVGAISNVKLAKEIYPGWVCRFYIHKPSVPQWVIDELNKFDNVEIVFYEDDVGWGGMLYRFYPATEDDVEIMLSRDTDSRLSLREKACVDNWLKSNKNLHVIRDTCVHQSQMMGGLWGTRNGYLKWIKPHIDDMLQKMRNGKARKGCDQDFLNSKVYLYAVGDIDKDGNKVNKLGPFDQNQISIISHDDIAFGCLRFPNFTRLPHVNDEMRKMPIRREYGESYHACIHCGMKHDNKYIGKVESLTKEETEYLNFSEEQKQERENILEYYKKYLINQYKYGLAPVQHEHGSEKIT